MGDLEKLAIALPPFHDSDQCELALDDVRVAKTIVVWDGRSPRVLTKSFQKFSLAAHPPGGPIQKR